MGPKFNQSSSAQSRRLSSATDKRWHKKWRLQSAVTCYVTDYEVWSFPPLWEQRVKGYRQTMWAVSLTASVWLNCVCLCISDPPSQSVTFSGALCTEHAKTPLSGRNNSVLGLLEQCLYWWESDRNKRERVERSRQSNWGDGDRSAVIIWLQSTSFTVTEKDFLREKKRLTEASAAQICRLTFEVHFDLAGAFAEQRQTTNGLGFPFQFYFIMQINSIYYAVHPL